MSCCGERMPHGTELLWKFALVTGLVMPGWMPLQALSSYAAERTAGPDAASLEEALRQSLPGDTVLLRPGVYRPIAITVSGKDGAPITIKAAPGARPVFDGSLVPAAPGNSGWKHLRGQVWTAPCPTAPLTVIADDKVLPFVADPGALTEGSYSYAGGLVYVWCPGGGAPAARGTGVLVYDRRPLVAVQGDWIVLDGILARFSSGTGIAVTGKHCEVRNCESKWSAGDGLRFNRPASIGRAVRNVVHHNFCNNFVRGARNSGWGYGLGTGAGVPDCEFIGNTSHHNNGEGLGCYNQSHRTVMRNNTVYDNWSVNIYIDSVEDCVVDGNMVFNTGRVPDPELRRSRPIGIMCADEVYRGGPYLRRLTVINNIVAGCQRGFSFSRWEGAMQGSVLKESLIANNTLVDNDIGISLAETLDSTIIANNIVVQRNGKACVQAANRDVSAVIPQWRNNLFFGSDPGCFYWPGQGMRFDQWTAAIRQVASLWADPGFADGAGTEPHNYRLRPDSLAIGRGVPIAGVDHDAAGNPRPQGAGIDLGAFQRATSSGGTPPALGVRRNSSRRPKAGPPPQKLPATAATAPAKP